MKKNIMQWIVVGLFVLFPILTQAGTVLKNKDDDTKYPLTCAEFLKTGVVRDQIQEEALDLDDSDLYQVSEEKGVCQLTVTKEGKTYVYTSKNPINFQYDGDKKFYLFLYRTDKPKRVNFIEGIYDPDTNDIIEAYYDFPTEKKS